MYCISLLVCYIILIVGTNGVSINKDAIELAQLAEEFWSLKPGIYQKQGTLALCQFIDDCCSTENRFQAISSMVDSITNEYHSKNRYARVLNTCIDSTVSEEVNRSCPLITQILSPIVTEQDRFDIIQHRRIVMNYSTELNKLIYHVNKRCNNEEIHALLCLSNTRLITSCSNKILQGIYHEYDLYEYQEFMTNAKQVLIDLKQQLSQRSMWSENTN